MFRPNRARRLLLLGLTIASLFVFIQGCSFSPRKAANSAPGAAFRPPTIVPPTLAVRQAAPPETRPTPPADCTDNLSFSADLSIPDGSEVQGASTMDKRWAVLNSGTCNWDERYSLRLIAGPDLGAPQQQALYPARSGSEAIIRVTFQAPVDPGDYRSAWQAFNAEDVPFGDPIYIDFVVSNP